MIAGISGGTRNGTAALTDAGQLAGVCSQERVTRVRGAGVNASGLPDESLDLLPQRLGRPRDAIGRYVVVDVDNPTPSATGDRIDHHFAHACTAYLTSPFTSSAVVVCDHEGPEVSVWVGEGPTLRQVAWPWRGPGFVSVFSRCPAAMGFRLAAADQRTEALARLQPDSRDPGSLVVDPGLERFIEQRLAGHGEAGSSAHATLAAALHARLAELLVDVLREVGAQLGVANVCLGGSLFYHSSMNTPDDNCKLQYSWESEAGGVATVRALQEGRLVGWFDGAMEWGPRALGARCILASPTASYVLENLNHFLERWDPWRGYALSGLQEFLAEHFEGAASAPFMECDYRPRDPAQFCEALPSVDAVARVHRVSAATGLPRFRRLLEAFGEATGLPFLVNTSFNGFHEPIVCNPRDAVRVFYGIGLDVLVINQFVLRK